MEPFKKVIATLPHRMHEDKRRARFGLRAMIFQLLFKAVIFSNYKVEDVD